MQLAHHSQFPARAATKGKIRGAALRELIVWFEVHHQGAAVDELIEGIADAYPDSFQPGLPAFGVISGKWYDAAAIHELLDVLQAASRNPRFALEGGKVVMSKTLSGVFRALTRFLLTPERYVKHAPRLWSHYYDTGRFEIGASGPTSTRTTIHDWHSHHPILCDMNVAAAEVIYSTIGCERARATRVQCTGQGAPHCEYEVHWIG